MKFGVTLPNLGVGDDPDVVVDLAVEAEAAGWDAVFVWDTPYASDLDGEFLPTHEAWICMSAIALRTHGVRIGTMITPLAWRRPWEVARQAATLDRLSGGRFILSVGLGWVPPEEGLAFNEETDRKVRARRLDEGLEILERCWSGERFSYEGEHYIVKDAQFLPRPVQRPRVPVWVVGAWHRDTEAWPQKRSLRRALDWDGVLPNVFEGDRRPVYDFSAEDVRPMAEWIRQQGSDRAFDVVIEQGSQDDTNTPADVVREWQQAGATWWLEPVWWSIYRHPGDPEPMRERIRRGPPRSANASA